MKRVQILSGLFSLVAALHCVGQSVDKDTRLREALIKKQIAINALEGDVKDVRFAAVRVFVRYKIASWLWKNGKDEVGRA
ncbi:MAG: hypothetical protein ACJ73D_06900, partial [Pyrinomonadaceae bacterium]